MNPPSEKLRTILARQGLMTGAEWRVKAAENRERRESGAFEIDTVVPGEILRGEDGGFYLVRQNFPLDFAHGQVTLGDALAAMGEHVSLAAKDEELLEFDARSAVFVDTETTGLAGGAGTVCFLVGVGYFTSDSFRLDQCFMRDYDDEGPMLAFLAERFANADTLVSYNGKSFDLPLLRTRFIQNRLPCRLDAMMHFDLVHASRRLFKRRLRDCSLGNVERHVLALERHGDVNSALIPQLWLDYLRTRDARRLDAVFYHHRTDILSLAALTGRLSQLLARSGGERLEHHEDRLSLVRLHFSQKHYDDVLALANQLIETLSDDRLRWECWEMLAFAAKRREQWEDMERAFESLIAECPRHLTARHELAKHYEHRRRDLDLAHKICVTTLQLIGPAHDGAADFRVRRDRLDRKLAKQTPSEL